MTAYVNSVQHGVITIGGSSTSGTATITSVGAKAFVIFGGWYSASVQQRSSDCRVELTNSTTVTATRSTSGFGSTATVPYCVIDPADALVDSVQQGTITISTGTSNTATITAVNSAHAVAVYLGATTNRTATTNTGTLNATLGYSGTTLTATRAQSSTDTTVVGYLILEFNGSALNSSVQNFSKSWSAASSTTQAVTSVTAANTICLYGGQATNTALASSGLARGTLTNGTTFTVTTPNRSTGTYNFGVVEFISGVLNSSVQRAETSYSTGTGTTATLSPSVTKNNSMMNFLGCTSSDATGLVFTKDFLDVELTDGSTVTLTNRAAISGTTNVGSWEVAEFVAAPPPSGGTFVFIGSFM